MELFIPFATEKDTGRMVSVGQVPRGLRCNCICPSCGQELEAVQGNKRIWHFRHAKQNSGMSECKHAYESAIHKAAKQLFEDGIVT